MYTNCFLYLRLVFIRVYSWFHQAGGHFFSKFSGKYKKNAEQNGPKRPYYNGLVCNSSFWGMDISHAQAHIRVEPALPHVGMPSARLGKVPARETLPKGQSSR